MNDAGERKHVVSEGAESFGKARDKTVISFPQTVALELDPDERGRRREG